MTKNKTYLAYLAFSLIFLPTHLTEAHNRMKDMSCDAPNVIISDFLSCRTTSVTLSGNSDIAGATYLWEYLDGPNDFNPNEAEIAVSYPGAYELTVTDPLGGCEADTVVFVEQNTYEPHASAETEPDLITCANFSVALFGGNYSENPVSYVWSGPDGFTSTEKDSEAYASGIYTLTVIDLVNGCVSTASTEVYGDIEPPLVTVSSTGNLTCATPSVMLYGDYDIRFATYSWEGPGGYETYDGYYTDVPGIYTYTVTSETNFCSASASIEVFQDITAPSAEASISGLLTCVNTEVTLFGSSDVGNASYSWTGPNGFTSVEQNSSAIFPGEYVVTVTDPSNGCTASASVLVIEDIEVPEVALDVLGELNCNPFSEVILTGYTDVPNAEYHWTGEGLTSPDGRSFVVTSEGWVTLKVIDPSNGCFVEFEKELIRYTEVGELTAEASGLLTCATSFVELSAFYSAIPDEYFYYWTGPGGIIGQEQQVFVDEPGLYEVTVYDSESFCEASASIEVFQDITAPSAEASISGLLTCVNTEVTLFGSSDVGNASYSWTGPNGFTSVEQNAVAILPGEYVVTVTDPSNGCTASASVLVFEDTYEPGAYIVIDEIYPGDGQITCGSPFVNLLGISGMENVHFFWEGPGGYTTTQQNPQVWQAGSYTLTVTSALSGCQSSASIEISENKEEPQNVKIDLSGELGCTPFSYVTLTASSSSAFVEYTWYGPIGGPLYNYGPSVEVQEPGIYRVYVSNYFSGCYVEREIEVPPVEVSELEVGVSGELTCQTPTVQLFAIDGSVSNAEYFWYGPGGYFSEQNPVVDVPGVYYLEAYNPANFCSAYTSIEVFQDITAPSAEASVSGVLNCIVTEVTLFGSSVTPDVAYSWTGPNGFVSIEPEPVVADPGVYVLAVTNTSNGCVSEVAVVVEEDNTGCTTAAAQTDRGQAIKALESEMAQWEHKAYPAPSNGPVSISFKSPKAANVKVQVYSLAGVKSATIFEGTVTPGQSNSVIFNEKNSFPKGIYFYVIETDKVSKLSGRIVLTD